MVKEELKALKERIKNDDKFSSLLQIWRSFSWIFYKTGREFQVNLFFISVFDLFHNTNFRGRIRHDKLGFSAVVGNDYSASPLFLKNVFRKLEISKDDSILDLGCGKGYAIYVMQQFGFKRIGGVELSKELTDLCIQNLKKICPDKTIKTITIHNADATEFGSKGTSMEEFDGYNYFYIYNSFPYEVMSLVKKNIDQSLNRSPRDIRIIYVFPAARELFENDERYKLEKQMYKERQSGGVFIYKSTITASN